MDAKLQKLRAARTVVFLLVSFFAIFVAAAMAEADETSSTDSIVSSSASSRPAVHIVYTERPRDEDPKDFHIRTLASVLGRFVSYFSLPFRFSSCFRNAKEDNRT